MIEMDIETGRRSTTVEKCEPDTLNVRGEKEKTDKIKQRL